jgi:hypothetical protein
MARVIHATTMKPTIVKSLLCDRFERQRREPHRHRNENAENLPDNDKRRVGIFEQVFSGR